MNEPIDVPELSVRVVTGEPADDPHGQGFAAIFAEFTTTDRSLIARLSTAKAERTQITVRSAMLDVTGPITKDTSARAGSKYVLAVDDVCYRKPKHSWEG